MKLSDGGYWSPDSGYLSVDGGWQFWADGDITPNKNDGTAFRSMPYNHMCTTSGCTGKILHEGNLWCQTCKSQMSHKVNQPYLTGPEGLIH